MRSIKLYTFSIGEDIKSGIRHSFALVFDHDDFRQLKDLFSKHILAAKTFLKLVKL